jgi:tetratricopeptide (TPR) repeat protein
MTTNMKEKNILLKKIGYQAAGSQEIQATTVGELDNLVKNHLNPTGIDNAEFYVSQLIHNAPKFSSAYISQAIIDLNKCRYTDAISMAEKAFSLGAQNRELFVTASIAYRENNQLDDALKIIEKASSLYPDGPRIQHELSVCENLVNPKTLTPTIAIVTTLKDVETTIESFIDYHLTSGIDRLFLFFDDPNDPSIRKASKYSQVTAIKHDEQLKSLWKNLPGYHQVEGQIDKEVMARQMLNVVIANRLCLNEGIDWLLHIDSDEAFYCPDESFKQHFESLTNRDIHNTRYLNHEALPPSLYTKF